MRFMLALMAVRVEDGDKENFVLYTENYGSKSIMI